MADTGKIAILLAGWMCLTVAGCATSGSLRTQPLTEGETRVFQAPSEAVLGAARQAFDQIGIRLDSSRNVDSATTMLFGSRTPSPGALALKLMVGGGSYGEVVRVVVASLGLGAATVRVMTRRALAVDMGSSGDLSDRIFRQLALFLGRADSTLVVGSHVRNDSSDVTARAIVIGSLRPDRTIRVHGPTIGTLVGAPLGVREGNLVWGQPHERPPVRLADIDSVWTRTGHSRTGATIGLLLGSLIAIPLGVQEAIRGDVAGMVYVPLLGFGLGAAFGAGVGGLIPSWHLRFP